MGERIPPIPPWHFPYPGWVVPTLRSAKGHFLLCDCHLATERRMVIEGPDELAGRVVVPVEGAPCPLTHGDQVCGLIGYHGGDHWLCDATLVRECGPWAVVRVTGIATLPPPPRRAAGAP